MVDWLLKLCWQVKLKQSSLRSLVSFTSWFAMLSQFFLLSFLQTAFSDVAQLGYGLKMAGVLLVGTKKINNNFSEEIIIYQKLICHFV